MNTIDDLPLTDRWIVDHRPPRQIIQLAAGENLAALCNDGTTWYLITEVEPGGTNSKLTWRLLPEIPPHE